MKQGYLSDYFEGVGAKRVSAHEIDPAVSRGHEFQGVEAFHKFIGKPGAKRRLDATYIWIGEGDFVDQVTTTVTWYDSRKGQSHRDPEGRFYYPAKAESVVRRAQDGDAFFVCLRKDQTLLFLLTGADTSAQKQLEWLFGISVDGMAFSLAEISETKRFEVGFAARYILELIGIAPADSDKGLLDGLLKKFGKSFPSTSDFSAEARKLAMKVDALANPDGALITWVDFEERLFRIFERYLIADRIQQGFAKGGAVDVDGFMRFSIGAHNRRKSRAGYSLENHLGHLFAQHQLSFDRGANTEGKKKPDFLFPSALAYSDMTFPAEALTLLGSKSTCKDRWRQVLTEGSRVVAKHLLTLEPSISTPQTDEMRASQLTLVLPTALHETYTVAQRSWLMSVAEFIDLVKKRAKSAP